jgi:hypothetical protein
MKNPFKETMIKLSINIDTFYRLQALSQKGFASEFKVYDDHAVIEVSKDVLSYLLGKMKENESIDVVIMRGISDYLGQMGKEKP